MARPPLEVAAVFRGHGARYRAQQPLPLYQQRLMRAIELCRTAALGGHKERCDHCLRERISYNSCCNRHCPKCQNMARAKWLQQRKRELLPIEYFHVVFTIPQQLNALALQNKELLYKLLFQTSAATLQTIAADPKHLGARIGFFSILHTWGQNLLSHPHIHCVATGGGLSPDGKRWISCRPGFFLPVRVLSRLFRRLLIEALESAFRRQLLRFHGQLDTLQQPAAFAALLEPLRDTEWVVYSKPSFGGPQQVIDYLGRYTHRVAISNDRLLTLDGDQVTFQYKDYRCPDRHKSRRMTVSAHEFIRRFLLHSLPAGFRRIRHYGLLAGRNKKSSLLVCRQLLDSLTALLPSPEELQHGLAQILVTILHCPFCAAGQMVRVEVIPPLKCFPAPDSS